MNAPTIPRKEIAVTEPSAVYLKEVDSHITTSDSGWEIPEDGRRNRAHHVGRASAARWALSDRFDRIFPPHKRYFGRSRRTLIIAILVLFFCILSLIIGLAVGLSGGSKKYYILFMTGSFVLTSVFRPQNLPLPNGAEVYTGDLTYYGTGMGACGITSTDNDPIVAISHYVFDAAQKGGDPNANPLCGRKIRARRHNEETNEDVSVDLTVVDRCKYSLGCLLT